MDNEYGVVILECDNLKSHAPHSWREGFLKLRKRTCQGYEKFEPNPWCKANPSIGQEISDEAWERLLKPTSQVVYKKARVDTEPEVQHKHTMTYVPKASNEYMMTWDCDVCKDYRHQVTRWYFWKGTPNVIFAWQ